ncbi:MAG TPA: hypothetical protein VH253_00950 [Phycisphaerae bacterium]|nr:hypothetical protein [Phycisphaerae bacterium]
MALRRLNKYLGIALGDQSILVAEVANAGGRREVRRYAEFAYPEGTSAAQLAGAGKAFGAFLKQHGFGSREAIFGLPARWVVIKPKELPPADPETAATLLRVQAEGEFSADLKEMVYDYAGESHPKQPRQVLLMGVPRERVDQIHAFAEAARVGVEGITSSVAALAAASKSLAAPEGIVVYLGGKAAELAVQTGHGLQRIRHFSTTPAAVGAGASTVPHGGTASGTASGAGGSYGTSELVAELRRTFAGLPQNGTPAADRKLVLWDGTGLDEEAQSAIGTRLGMPVAAQNLTAMGVGGQQLTAEASRFAPAVALATIPYLPEGLPVNFDDSRLKPPVESSTRNKVTWAVAIGLLVAIGIGWAVWDSNQQQAQIDSIKSQIATMKPAYNDAVVLLKNESDAKSWYGGQTPYMDCFVAVSNAILQVPNAYATNLNLQPALNPLKADRPTPSAGGVAGTQPSAGTLKGQVTGICQNKETPTSIAKAMFDTGEFQDAKVISVDAVKAQNATPNTGRGARGGAAAQQPQDRGGRGARGGGPGGRNGNNDGLDYNYVIGFTFTGPPPAKTGKDAAKEPAKESANPATPANPRQAGNTGGPRRNATENPANMPAAAPAVKNTETNGAGNTPKTPTTTGARGASETNNGTE